MRQHIIDGKTFKRICGDDTRYGYVSDEVYKTWEKCPVCFAEGRIVSAMSHIHGVTQRVKIEKKGLYLRDALE